MNLYTSPRSACTAMRRFLQPMSGKFGFYTAFCERDAKIEPLKYAAGTAWQNPGKPRRMTCGSNPHGFTAEVDLRTFMLELKRR